VQHLARRPDRRAGSRTQRARLSGGRARHGCLRSTLKCRAPRQRPCRASHWGRDTLASQRAPITGRNHAQGVRLAAPPCAPPRQHGPPPTEVSTDRGTGQPPHCDMGRAEVNSATGGGLLVPASGAQLIDQPVAAVGWIVALLSRSSSAACWADRVLARRVASWSSSRLTCSGSGSA
jgi:hypothetical protein